MFFYCLFIILSVLVVYVFLKRNYSYWEKYGVKQIPPKLFFGNILPFILARKTPSDCIQELYQKGEGNDFIGFYAFNKPYLMVRNPEFIKQILVKDFKNFSNKIMCSNDKYDIMSTNLFTAKDPPWRDIRNKLSSFFTSAKLKRMFELMLEIVPDLTDHLEKLKIDDKIGVPVAMKEINAHFMTDIVGVTTFGLKCNSLTGPNCVFDEYTNAVFRPTYMRHLQILSIYFLPPLRYFLRAKLFDEKGTIFFRNKFWEVIQERMKSGLKRNDLIDLLIEMSNKQNHDSYNTFNLEGDSLVAQASIFFFGGYETSSTTLSFAILELANNSDVQRRLRNEILDALKQSNGKINFEMITTLPYLKMVVQETLRLYSINSWVDRIAESDYIFPGTNVTVKSGIPVIIPIRSLQMDPKWFPNPEKFDPERFSHANKHKIIPFTYIPFGEGPRSCIGSRLGMIQVSLGVLFYISHFEITPCEQISSPIKLEKQCILTMFNGKACVNLRRLTV